jgi:formate-dependent nitrite reductase membrane component NrfD
MALRQWMITHQWMVKPTPQTEWIERRGMLVWIAEVFTSLGAGLYLVSIFFNNWWGMLAAWMIIMFLKIPLHLMYFGKPLRFWRTVPPFTKAWKTSWFTRGISFSIIFGGIVFMQLVITYFFPDTGWDITLKVLGGISAFLIGIYSGFIMSYCRSVPFWNSAMLPMILIFAGVADGFALLIGIGLADPQIDIVAAEGGSRIMLIINVILMAVYLWNATYISKTARYSAGLLLRGRLAIPFWAGVVAFGMIIPLGISTSSYFISEASAPLLIVAVILHTIGAVALKYVLLKAGVHNPILPVTTTTFH